MNLLRTKIRVIALIVVVLIVAIGFGLGGMLMMVSGGSQKTATPPEACNAQPGAPGEIPPAPAEIQAQQIANAKLIDQAAQEVGVSGKGSRIAIITAMGESSLINLDYGDEGNGVVNPGGKPTDSKGLFQQQPSQGWGTIEQVMDPKYATTSFLTGPKHDRKRGLVSVLHWEDSTYISSIIHQVQGNANRDHYTQFIQPADVVISLAGIDVDRPGSEVQPSASPGSSAAPTDGTDICDGESRPVNPIDPNDDYPWVSITPGPGVYVEDPLGYFYGECTSYVAWRINRDAGSTTAPFKYSAAAGNFGNGNGYEWKTAWLARGWKVSSIPVVGSVAWWDANGGVGIGPYGHVAYVEEVTPDGKVIISEYNNEGLSPPGHRYSLRTEAMDPSEFSGFLYPPPAD